MKRSIKWLSVMTGAVIAAATTSVVAASQAAATTPGQVQPGATVCSQQIRADQGVVLSGSSTTNNGSGPSWSIRVTGTADGQETEVLRTPARTLPPTSMTPPAPGTWYFRGCMKNTGPLPTTVQLQINPL